MEKEYRAIIKAIGEKVSRQGLKKTPQRAATAMQFLTQGYQADIKGIVNEALFDSDNDDMIVVKDIELYSLCEHHMLPFFGKCHVGYIPNGKVIGVSKIPRIVDVFARRLQIQEELTTQIADTIHKYTNALGVGVVINAQHLCMMMRGVEKQNSRLLTSCMTGVFRKNQTTRQEFFRHIQK